MNFLIAVLIGALGIKLMIPIVLLIGRIFQLWGVLPERRVLVYTLFGKVIGEVTEAGIN